MIIASSEEDKARKVRSFRNTNVVITGNPRNDYLIANASRKLELIPDNLRQFDKIITYAPTFRDSGIHVPFSEAFMDKLQEYLAKKNYLFLVKSHPKDTGLRLPSSSDNILNSAEISLDIQSILAVTDILVSDYSGIVTDFSLTKRPLIFYVYDYADYVLKSREFYYDYKKTLPGPFLTEETELIKYFDDMSWYLDSNYQEKYEKFIRLFNKYDDCNSTARVIHKAVALSMHA
jgi:CDP-glycerol glycerophosphotransferase